MTHVDEVTCMLYLDGQLDRGRAEELARHVEACAGCRHLLAALEQEGALLREALLEENEPVPARLRVAPERRERAAWWWIAALAAATAGVYTLWTQMIAPWQSSLEVAGFADRSILSMLLFSGAFWGGWEDVMNLMQTLGTGTLLLLGLILVMRLRRRWAPLAVVMGALAMTLALSAPAAAAEVVKREYYSLPAGETVRGDLFLFSHTARIEGTIEGDLFFLGDTLELRGIVRGDVIAAGKSLLIGGEVDGNVRSAGNSLTIRGRVARNVTVFAEAFDLEPEATAAGSLYAFADRAKLEGALGRDLHTFVKRLLLAGKIGGHALMRGERLTVDAAAEIAGSARFRGAREPDVSPQARLASPVEFEKLVRKAPYTEWRFYWRQALRWGATLVFGLLLLWLTPAFFRDALRSGSDLGRTLAWGGGLAVLLPIASVIACITLVGLAAGISGLVLWGIALYASQVFAGAWLGGMLLKGGANTGRLIAALAVGLLVLRAASHIPWAGGWIVVAAGVWGLGLMGSAIYARLRPQPLSA